MPIVTCPKCESRYDPGVDEELEGIDPSEMSLKVVGPVCALDPIARERPGRRTGSLPQDPGEHDEAVPPH